MKSVVLESNAKLSLREIPAPIADSQRSVIVRISAAGICGSDIPRAFAGGAYHYPLVMGHELSGVVDQAPSSAGFTPGDRVVIFPLLPCYRCDACSVGEYAQCIDYDYLGSRSDGGFSEFVAVPEANLFRIPDHLDTTHAALTEPTAVALHALAKTSISPGSNAVVFGGGPIGLLTAQWLRIRGANDIYVVDVDAGKLKTADDLGCIPIDATKTDPVESIRAARSAAKAAASRIDLAVEACGLPITYRQSLEVVDTFGEVVLMGNIKGDFGLDERLVSSILRREISIFGTWNSRVTPHGNNEWTTSLQTMDRTIRIAPIVSHRISLAETPKMLEGMFNRSVDHFRVVVLPDKAT